MRVVVFMTYDLTIDLAMELYPIELISMREALTKEPRYLSGGTIVTIYDSLPFIRLLCITSLLMV